MMMMKIHLRNDLSYVEFMNESAKLVLYKSVVSTWSASVQFEWVIADCFAPNVDC